MTEGIDFKRNSLNTFRLIAALQVLQGHVLAHLELDRVPVFGDFISFFYGVPIFFTLSGFLIWQSIGRSRTFVDYAKKRFWRIYPELWVAVTIELVVILILYQQPIDWPQMGLFTVGQTTIFQFWTPDFLRGYGCGTPNGALWTITVLIQFYFLSYFIYKWLHNKKIVVWGGVTIFFLFVAWVTPEISRSMPDVIGKIYGVSLIPFMWMFLVPAFAAEHKDIVVVFLKKYWWAFIIVLIINKYFLHFDIEIALYPFINTILLFGGLIGFSYVFPCLNIKTDISYGVYIYHMTVVNALMELGYIGKEWTYWLVIVVTCLLAWVSTVTIGRLSVIQKQKLY